ncbi:MAG TPA: rod shape-determining protein MreC [Epsilonproteobacteria bacterium]|nr:rod shape-determining protein MreC [Campylobacterota bacterium]
MRQLGNINQIIPSLQQYPAESVALAQTISYVKLNSLSQIILTKPKNITNKKLYGLVHNGVVGGVAKSDGVQFFGYLVTDENCRFSVSIGDKKAPGIAKGSGDDLIAVHFIPKWQEIKVGDKVTTSGLDNIFFSNIPVGVVTRVETQSSYKVAYVEPYSDLYHPKIFFVLLDAKPTLLYDFDVATLSTLSSAPTKQSSQSIIKEVNSTFETTEEIPEVIDQTQEEVVYPEPATPSTAPAARAPKPSKPKPSKPKPSKPKPSKPKPSNTLDMF